MKQLPLKYLITKKDGQESVTGFYLENLPGLAIRKVEAAYFVDHVPSGMVMTVCTRKGSAVELIQDIGELLEWEVDLDQLKETFATYPEVFRYVYHRVYSFSFPRPEPLARKARGQTVLF